MLKNAPCQEPFVHHTVLAKQAMIFPAINTPYTFQVLAILSRTYIQHLAQTRVRGFHSRYRLCCKAAELASGCGANSAQRDRAAKHSLESTCLAAAKLRYPAVPAVHIQHQKSQADSQTLA